MTLAERLLEELAQLDGDATSWENIWRECAELCLPERWLTFSTASNTPSPSIRKYAAIAQDSLRVLTSGLLGWTTPSQTPWFRWEPTEGREGSEALKSWLAQSSQKAHRILGNSNFYTVAHQFHLERCTYGTAAMMVEPGRNGAALNFKLWPAGSFRFSENAAGIADRVFRKYRLTARQAVELFGPDAPDQCQKEVSGNKGNTLHEFLHAIVPRAPADRNPRGGPFGLPVASYQIHKASKKITAESGFESMPVFVSRWLRWHDDSVWGISPAIISIADIEGVNKVNRLLDARMQLGVEPRIIAKTGAVGHIDLSAGGVTQVRDMADAPQTWADSGADYRIGMDVLERREQFIRRAFHATLFEAVSPIDREMTATEILARQREQVGQISPAFTLLTTEFLNPLLEAVFMRLVISGRFGEVPPDAVADTPSGQQILFPATVQTSRLAFAVDSLNSEALLSTVGEMGPLIQAQPSLLDNLNLDQALREIARGRGVPADWINNPDAVAEIRQAQAQQAQQQQMLDLAAKQPELAAQAAQAGMI
jgi:hypothetical protein